MGFFGILQDFLGFFGILQDFEGFSGIFSKCTKFWRVIYLSVLSQIFKNEPHYNPIFDRFDCTKIKENHNDDFFFLRISVSPQNSSASDSITIPFPHTHTGTHRFTSGPLDPFFTYNRRWCVRMTFKYRYHTTPYILVTPQHVSNTTTTTDAGMPDFTLKAGFSLNVFTKKNIVFLKL